MSVGERRSMSVGEKCAHAPPTVTDRRYNAQAAMSPSDVSELWYAHPSHRTDHVS